MHRSKTGLILLLRNKYFYSPMELTLQTPLALYSRKFMGCWASCLCPSVSVWLSAYKTVTYVFRKFAPRCCVCQLPIMPEPGQDETVRVVALDRSFHIACYKCEVSTQLQSRNTFGRPAYAWTYMLLCPERVCVALRCNIKFVLCKQYIKAVA